MTDELLDECERLYADLNATPRWRWFRRWRMRNEWLGAVATLETREIIEANKRRAASWASGPGKSGVGY